MQENKWKIKLFELFMALPFLSVGALGSSATGSNCRWVHWYVETVHTEIRVGAPQAGTDLESYPLVLASIWE